MLCDNLEGWDREDGGREVQEAGDVCMCACMVSHFSHVQFFATLWTIAHQSPLSMEFSRQEYYSGLPCPPPRDFPNPEIKPASLRSPALAGGFTTAPPENESY